MKNKSRYIVYNSIEIPIYTLYYDMTVHDLRNAYIMFSPGRRGQSINTINDFFPEVISNIVVQYSGGAPYYDSRLDPQKLYNLRQKLVYAKSQCHTCLKKKQMCSCGNISIMSDAKFIEKASNIMEGIKKKKRN
jgi:hypothetical protein